MKSLINLKDYITQGDSLNKDEVHVIIDPNSITPGAEDTFRKLNRLGLLNDKVVMALIGQAPIDPGGLVAFCSSLGGWEFMTDSFAARKALVRDSVTKEALSYMVIDLLSNQLMFVKKDGDKLATLASYTLEDLNAAVSEAADRSEALMAFIEAEIMKVVKYDKANQGA